MLLLRLARSRSTPCVGQYLSTVVAQVGRDGLVTAKCLALVACPSGRPGVLLPQ
jgi:hypothetical protein